VLLQTTLNIPPGSSGGALLDLKGNWIGLLTALPGVTGADTSGGYALPIDGHIKPIIDKLAKGLDIEYGFLGIGIGQDRQFGPGPPGLSGWKPTLGGPAQKAGMLSGDEIISINGEPIRDDQDLLFSIGTALAGTQISMVVRRGGREEELRPVLVKTNWPEPTPAIASNRPAPIHGLRVDYTSVLYQGADQTIAGGVLVREVEESSPAARAGLRPDKDIITSVNGRRVDTPAEFYRIAKESGNKLELMVGEKEGPQRPVRLP
jgi:S1-C subfamily serine protease